MRQDRFTLDNLMEYIYNQQIAQIPAKMYNDDAQVKYLEFGSLYTYCCHGNKEHQIRRWLRERIAYVDSMLGYFTSQDDQVTIRMNKSGAVSFSVTTYIPLYFSVKWSNAQGGVQTIKMKRGETKEFSYNSTTSTDQEVIIYHAQYIKDLNNLSNLNPSSCILANALKLTNVEIHSPLLYNINVTNNKYLRNINLRNCSALGTVTATGSSLDLSKCKYLQHCDIYNTNLTEVQLGSDGGSLLDIYYPKTVQTIQLIKQRLLHTIGLPYGNNGDEIPTALYTVTIQECPSITKLNTSTNAAINSSFISMSYCNNLTIRNALDLEELNFDGFHRLKNVIIENMYNLTSVGFNDLLPKGETSTIQYIGMSNCPKLETLELNCTSNDYEITFADKAVLNLGGLFGLKSITSNCVLKGIETIVIPTKLESMFFTNDYGEGYSSIKNIWVSSVCDVNTSGTTAKVTYIGDSNYSGIDFNGMNLKNIDLGALVNIPNAINFNIAPTTVNPHFNLNRDGETYPYLQPEGSIDLSNYTESLARFFDGVDLDKMQIICKGSLPQTDLSYCFYNATFSKLQSITTLLNKVANIVNLDYCFYRTTINSTSVINSIKMGANSTMNYTFAECSNITTLNNVTIPKNVTAVEGMFYKCPLTSINSMIVNVQGSIKGLFKGCENLTSITTLLIPNVTDVESTFEGCINLETLTGFNLPATCTNVSNLFKGCYKLTRLNGLNLGSTLTKGDTWCPPNLTTVENCTINTDKAKFTNVTSLVTIQDTNITGDDLSDLFNGCTSLNTIKNCNITANKSLARAFKNCSLITQPPINVIKDSVTNIDEMYSGCTGITNISGMTFGNGITSATNWIPNTTITTADNITIKNDYIKFTSNTNLTSCNNLLITSTVTNLANLFEGCKNLNSFSFHNSCNLSKVTTMEKTFYNMDSLAELDFKNLDISSMTNMTDFIRKNSNDITIKNLKLTSSNCRYNGAFLYPWYFENIYIGNNNAVYAFGKSSSSYPSKVKTITGITFGENVSDISAMFSNCPNLTQDFTIPSHITNCTETFKGCTSMTHIHSNWNNSYNSTITATDCYTGCTGITYIDDVNVITYEGDNGLDYVPLEWGGNGFTLDNTMIFQINITSNLVNQPLRPIGVPSLLSIDYTKARINWGDGSAVEPLCADNKNITTHSYTSEGLYYVKAHCAFGMGYGAGFASALYKVLQIPKYRGGNKYTILSYGFSGANNLVSVDLSNIEIDTSAQYMLRGMFQNCNKLETIIWFKQKIKIADNLDGISDMFRACSSLKSLDLRILDISTATNISGLCAGCSSLQEVDISTWDTSKITSTATMFYDCTNLTSIIGIGNLDLSNCTVLSLMFYRCNSLETIDTSNWNCKNSGNGVFQNCSSLKEIKGIENLVNSNWISCNSLFRGCTKLTSINASNWDLSNVTNVESMFQQCSSLTSLDLSKFNFNHKSISYNNMFDGCSNLTSLLLPSLMQGKSFYKMFSYCNSLTDLRGTTFEDITQETESDGNSNGMTFMFDNCIKLEYIDTLINKGGLRSTFASCKSLKSIKELRFARTDSNYDTYQIFVAMSQNPNIIDINFTLESNGKGPSYFTGTSTNNTWNQPNLSRDTVVKLFNCLSTFEGSSTTIGSTANPLALSASTKARLTSSDISIITKKGWTLA